MLIIFEILYNKTEISISITPIIKAPIETKVDGIEKYRVSLKSETVSIEKIIPIDSKITPGIPRNFSGCLMAICSISDAITLVVCDTGFVVEVLPPVL